MSTTSQKSRPVDADVDEDTGTFTELFDDVAAKPSLDHEPQRALAHRFLDHVIEGEARMALLHVGDRVISIEAK